MPPIASLKFGLARRARWLPGNFPTQQPCFERSNFFPGKSSRSGDGSSNTACGDPGHLRKILVQMDGPVRRATCGGGNRSRVTVARHKRREVGSCYVLGGRLDLPVEGQPMRALM